MPKKSDFQERYRSGLTPWDIGKPDFNLINVVEEHSICPCRALEAGCGTGDNSIWLARQGFTVTGTDISELAVSTARRRAEQAGVSCTFEVHDFLRHAVPGQTFGFLFDRGCFHTFTAGRDRKKFARRAATCLSEGGLWLSIIGQPEKEKTAGPPRMSVLDIAAAVEKSFRILSIKSSHLESHHEKNPRAWVCLMERR